MNEHTENHKIRHRHWQEGECPRCRGTNTASWGRDVVTETFSCLDCQAKDAQECDFQVIRDDGIQSVLWGGEDGYDNEVYDSDYLVRRAAKELLQAADDCQAVMDAAANQLSTGEYVSPTELEAVARQLSEYAMKARAALAIAKGEEA